MAINLNPGADANITAAAARAGMALAPEDLGETYRSFSTKYAEAQKQVGENLSAAGAYVGVGIKRIKV